MSLHGARVRRTRWMDVFSGGSVCKRAHALAYNWLDGQCLWARACAHGLQCVSVSARVRRVLHGYVFGGVGASGCGRFRMSLVGWPRMA